MMTNKLDTDVFDLITRLRELQERADTQTAHQCDLKEQLKVAEERVRTLHPVICDETDVAVLDLVNRLQQMRDKTDALTEYQYDLKAQLKIAEDKALALHQKIVEESRDVGGEG